MGAAYKPRERSRSPGLLSTNVPYGWMKYQVGWAEAGSPRCQGWRPGSLAPSAATLVPTRPCTGGKGNICPFTDSGPQTVLE